MASIKDDVKAAGGTVGNLFNIPVDKCLPNPNNIRIDTPDLQTHIRKLADDMQARGYDRNQPVEFRRLPDGFFQVQNGNCRLAAVLLANSEGASIVSISGLPEPDGLNEQQRTARMVLANSGKHHTQEEYAIVIGKYRSWGWEDKDTAVTLQISISTLLNYMMLARAPEPIREAVQGGVISASGAVSLVRSEGDNASKVLAEAVKEADKQEGKKQGRVTAATINKVTGTSGAAARKVNAKRASEDNDNLPGQVLVEAAPSVVARLAKQAESAVSPEDKILDTVLKQSASQALAVRQRLNEFEVTSRALIDAYEGPGGMVFLEALDRLKELVGWFPIAQAAD